MIDFETRELISVAVEKAMGPLSTVERKAIHGTQGDKTMQNTGDTGGFKSFGEYLCAVKDAPNDARLKAGLSEGADSAGGYTVPEVYSSEILMMSLEESVVRSHGATVFPMTSDSLKIPKIVDTTHTDGSGVAGGIIAYWMEEGGTASVVEPKFGQVNLIAKKLTGYTYCSNELMEDNAVGLETFLTKSFAGALAWYEDDAFISGSGVGQPLGFMNSGALIASTRATASSVITVDLGKMWSRIYPSSINRCVWLCNPEVLAQLAQIGATNLTWLSSEHSISKPVPLTLFGRPLYTSEKMPALGAAGDICLVDLSYYLIGDRKRLTISASPHLRFLTDETCWRFVTRVDGQPWINSVFTPAHGGTLSPFIALDTK